MSDFKIMHLTMNSKLIILEAYTDQSHWTKFYNQIYDLFSDPADLIVRAKTYSLISACIDIRDRTGVSHEKIYQNLKDTSEQLEWLKFSSELKLDTFETYLKSVYAISIALQKLSAPDG